MKYMHFLLGAALASTSMIAFSPSDGAGGAAATPVTETKTILKQNGIKRPDAGSVTGKLWDIADDESSKIGKPAPRKSVVDRYMAEQPNANVATANTQYARWVTYNGASDILRASRAAAKADKLAASEAERAEAKAKKEAEKAAKQQEADAKKAAREAEKAQKAAEKKAADEAKAAEKAAADKVAADAKAAADAAAAQAGAGAAPAKAAKK